RVRLLDALPLGEVCPPTNHSHLLHRRKGRRKERKPSKSLVLPSEDPLSEKKRGHGEGIGPSNMKSNLMKKAKLEYRNR
ncbi:unnamed protein product, partial [Musa acuminata subsp. burmannicoides]